MYKVVIGIAGVKTSGKSTAAGIVKELLGGNISESALADKLKNVSGEVFNVPREHFDNQDVKEVPFTDGPKTLTRENIFDILFKFNAGMNQGDFNQKYNGIIGMELDTPRKIAQIVGTEVLRAAGDEDIHCKNVELTGEVTIVSDLRFPNEFNYFQKASDIVFLPMYIQRDEAESHVTEDSHPSEKCVFEFSGKCYEINNNGNLESLKQQIASLLVQTGFIDEMPKQA